MGENNKKQKESKSLDWWCKNVCGNHLSRSSICLSHLSTCLCWLAVIWAAIKASFTEGEHNVSSLHIQLLYKYRALSVSFRFQSQTIWTGRDCWSMMLIMTNERKIKYIDENWGGGIMARDAVCFMDSGVSFLWQLNQQHGRTRKGRFQRTKGFKRGLEGWETPHVLVFLSSFVSSRLTALLLVQCCQCTRPQGNPTTWQTTHTHTKP